MAVTPGSSTWIGKRTSKTTWASVPNGNTGSAEGLHRLSKVSIQVKGTLGVGGSVSIEGSNDGGTTWHVLNDDRGEGNAMTFTALDTRQLNEVPELIRPNVTAGDGSTSLTIIAVATRP